MGIMSKYKISLIEGDGIGPELAASAKKILETIHDTTETKFEIKQVSAGDNALVKYGKALPDFTVNDIKNSDACLKSPVGEFAADVIIVLRRMFDLYANIRPAKSYPNIKGLYDDVDLVIVRENTEDVYIGWEFNLDDDTIIALRLATKRASERIAQYAFKVAEFRNKNNKKVTAVHKANVLRKSDRLFVNSCKNVAQKYPNVQFNDSYVDACAMNLIRNPQDFDVIVTTNLFGDILSDEAAQVVGGLGMGPTANIGDNFALFEPVHGAAFDIAGKDVANPSSLILSAKMMMEWLSSKNKDNKILEESKKLESIIISMLQENKKTIDIGGKLSTTEFTENVIKKLKEYY